MDGRMRTGERPLKATTSAKTPNPKNILVVGKLGFGISLRSMLYIEYIHVSNFVMDLLPSQIKRTIEEFTKAARHWAEVC